MLNKELRHVVEEKVLDAYESQRIRGQERQI